MKVIKYIVKTATYLFLGTFGVIYTITACGAKDTENIVDVEVPKPDTIALIADPNFENGIILARQNGPSPGSIYPFGNNNKTPIWKMAEWGSKFMLSELDRKEVDGTVTYQNEGKYIQFAKKTGTTQIKMGVITSKEYDKPRVMNQFWPHLLLEQEFTNMPYLKNLQKIFVKFNGKLNLSERKMTDAEYNQGLHAAQFQLFVTVQNRNPKSVYYGDFLWFGIPFYDNRYPVISLYAAQDAAKDDASGKFIYSIASNDVTKTSFHDKKRIEINVDIYPHIIKALDLAKKRGYLTGSFFEEFQLSGMNIGWEIPGTFDTEFEYDGFGIYAITK